MSTEKYLSEAQMKSTPSKRLNLVIRDSSVITNKINDEAVTTAKIRKYNVTHDRMANDSVGTENIIDHTIQSVDLSRVSDVNGGAVATDNIQNDAVITNKILNKNVTTAKIDDYAVTTVKIRDANVTIDKMATNSVGNTNIVDQAVDNYKIKDSTIELEKLSKSLRDVINAATGVSGDLAEDIDKLMKKNFPLEVTYTFTPTALQEKGTTDVSVNINSFSAKVDSETKPITRITINKTILSGSSFTDAISDTKSYTIIIEADGRKDTSTKTVTFVYPIYVFFSAESDYTKITSLTGKQSLATSLNISNKTFTNTGTTDEYLYIVSGYTPSSVQSVSGLTLSIPGSVRGTIDNLNYWRSNDALSSGDWTLTIK